MAPTSSRRLSTPSHLVFSLPIERVDLPTAEATLLAVRQRANALRSQLSDQMEMQRAACSKGVRLHDCGSKMRQQDEANTKGKINLALRRTARCDGALCSLISFLQRWDSAAAQELLRANHVHEVTDSNIESAVLRLSRLPALIMAPPPSLLSQRLIKRPATSDAISRPEQKLKLGTRRRKARTPRGWPTAAQQEAAAHHQLSERDRLYQISSMRAFSQCQAIAEVSRAFQPTELDTRWIEQPWCSPRDDGGGGVIPLPPPPRSSSRPESLPSASQQWRNAGASARAVHTWYAWAMQERERSAKWLVIGALIRARRKLTAWNAFRTRLEQPFAPHPLLQY